MSYKSSSDVSIVIVTHNQLILLKNLLDSIYAKTTTSLTFEVIVVDNCSDSKVVEFLEEATNEYWDFRYVRNHENRYYGGGCNDGARVAQGEYIVFLNDDMEVETGWLAAGIRRLQENTEIGLVGAKLLYADRKIQHCGLEFVPNVRPGKPLWPIHINVGVPEDLQAVNTARMKEAVTGACVFMRRQEFFDLGGFDTRYVVDFEDMDLCMKVWQSGKKVFYEPESVLIHYEGITIGCDLERDAKNLRSGKIFFRRWNSYLQELRQERFQSGEADDVTKQYPLQEQRKHTRNPRTAASSTQKDDPGFGFNLFGYIDGNLGLGVTTRALADGIIAKGYPLKIMSLDPGKNRQQSESVYDAYKVADFNDFDLGINLFALAPDGLAWLYSRQPWMFAKRGGMNMNCSPMELQTLPEEWLPAMRSMDVALCISHYIKNTLDAHLPNTTNIFMEHPLNIPKDLVAQRDMFGLPQDATIFLAAFEPYSDVKRKNPVGAVQAFLAGAGNNPKAHLVLKINNLDKEAERSSELKKLFDLCGRHKRIHILSASLSYQDVLALYACCDVLLSLHCAEGLGLVPMEAMLLGVPVIATGWSGNLSYMTHDNSCLVKYDLKPVDGDYDHYQSSAYGKSVLWAEPKIDDAARWVKRLVENERFRQQLGHRAKKSMQEFQKRAWQGNFWDQIEAIWENRYGAKTMCMTPVQKPSKSLLKKNEEPHKNAKEISYDEWRCVRDELVYDSSSSGVSFKLVLRVERPIEDEIKTSLRSLRAQNYENWELLVFSPFSEPNWFKELCAESKRTIIWRKISKSTEEQCLKAMIDLDESQWLGVLEQGDRLDKQALTLLAKEVACHPDWSFVYYDEDCVDQAGRHFSPSFKSSFDLKHLEAAPYIGTSCFFRGEDFLAVADALRFDKLLAYEACFLIVEKFGRESIGHIHDVLLHKNIAHKQGLIDQRSCEIVASHLKRQGVVCSVEVDKERSCHQTSFANMALPKVEIFIYAEGTAETIQRCLFALARNTKYENAQVTVLLNGDKTDEFKEDVKGLLRGMAGFKLIDSKKELSRAGYFNQVARQSDAETVVFLDSGCQIMQEGWLSMLLEQERDNNVAVVSPKLVFPQEKKQTTGLVLGGGKEAVADYAMTELQLQKPGWQKRQQLTHEVGASSAHCLVISRDKFLALNGFDEERFSNHCFDLDFCLKARKRHWTTVCVPKVILVAYGAAHYPIERVCDGQKDGLVRRLKWRNEARLEKTLLSSTWSKELSRDPYANFNISINNADEQLEQKFLSIQELANRAAPKVLYLGDRKNPEMILAEELSVKDDFEIVRLSSDCEEGVDGVSIMPSDISRLNLAFTYVDNKFDWKTIQQIRALREFSSGPVITRLEQDYRAIEGRKKYALKGKIDLLNRIEAIVALSDKLLTPSSALAQCFQHKTAATVKRNRNGELCASAA